ncbi:pilus assembly protein TadG-related protein [Photobacterium leiognathi]|uniref:pilus assembly protein TadG-related protein n=1 Tax=Photobacterium leiognathi TaxID=553611 RepID=UPI0029822831|nr:pilus assembly protein TadG-related protein [Photobacterium leiognathi]
MKKQQGVAAIILVLILIPLFGCVFFALEGTRYIQKKTRLADASEAAAIAVTEQNPNQLDVNVLSDPNTTKITDSVLAKNYIHSYIRNIKNEDISIQPSVTENYYQYNVNVNTEHQSWFNSTLIPSFKKTQSISESALARNDFISSKDSSIDLVLVADFSGSMNDKMYSFGPTKIQILKKNIKSIFNSTFKEENTNDSNFSFVPFDMRTQYKEKKSDNNLICQSSLQYKNFDEIKYFYSLPNNFTDYNKIEFNEYKSEDKNNLIKKTYPTFVHENGICCLKNDQDDCLRDSNNNVIKFHESSFGNCKKSNYYNISKYNGGYSIEYNENTYNIDYTLNQKKINTILDLFDKTKKELNYFQEFFDNYYYPDPFLYVDIERTIANIFNPNENTNNNFNKNNNNLFGKYICKSDFWTIPLTNNIKEFNNQIDEMEAGGNTSVYQGLLKGFEIVNKGKHKNKILILFSDGDDAPYEKTFPELISHGMCEKIRDHLKDKGDNFYMGVIGIKYNAKKHTELVDCFGIENIYEANDSEILENKINQIISKGRKNIGITKLSDGQN